jgi:hypothetical protein
MLLLFQFQKLRRVATAKIAAKMSERTTELLYRHKRTSYSV